MICFCLHFVSCYQFSAGNGDDGVDEGPPRKKGMRYFRRFFLRTFFQLLQKPWLLSFLHSLSTILTKLYLLKCFLTVQKVRKLFCCWGFSYMFLIFSHLNSDLQGRLRLFEAAEGLASRSCRRIASTIHIIPKAKLTVMHSNLIFESHKMKLSC